ncbi:hypothetical protein CIP107575_00730 [Corynebacterium diphtheriae]|nr:hypothetical protein CIP107575_00730 [Corynebacterium diphtheriae]
MRNAIPVLVAALMLAGCSGPDGDTSPAPQSTTLSATSTPTSQKQAPTSTPATSKPPAAETVPAAIAPAPQQAPEAVNEAPPAVIGFMGAPGHDTPRALDKVIDSCGDPHIHETGTTFFTDGTSGWTQQCSDTMLAQRPAPVPAPVPAPAHAPEPAGTVHPGAFCNGGTGVSKTGKPMICAPATDGRNRWQAA